MLFEISVPSKTFLLGEYIALDGGPSILASTPKRFRLKIKSRQITTFDSTVDQDSHTKEGCGIKYINKSLKWLHPKSPAGRWVIKNPKAFRHFEFEFIDPYGGSGGLGASSAQFVLMYVWDKIQSDPSIFDLKDFNLQKLWQDYQKLFETDSRPPSGADIISQFVGGVTVFQSSPFLVERLTWPFENESFCLLKTKNKITTHDHLNHLKNREFGEMKPIVIKAVEALKKDEPFEFLLATQQFYKCLQSYKLVSRQTSALVNHLMGAGSVLGVKGCGAMGADVLFVLCEKPHLTSLRQLTQVVGLEWIASSEDLCGGIQVKIEFDWQKNKPGSKDSYSEVNHV